MWPFVTSVGWRRGHEFSPSDTLPFVAAPGAEQPVELRSLDVQVVVSGLLAETTQTMRFYNPNRRVLEGTLTFPMAAGAVVCGYALDVEGQMVDGVVVPKEEARRILEAEIRRGVDPGLMEQVQGNLYRTRLYPIPAEGRRTVRVTTVSRLTASGSAAAYDLPLKHAAQVDEVSLRVEVIQAPVTPEISGGLGNLSLTRWEDRWVAEATLGGGRSSEDLQVRLPDLPDAFTTVEETRSGERFFCVSAELAEREERLWSPARVAIAWDASGSRAQHEPDLALLGELLRRWRGVVIDLVVFRDRPEPVQTFETEGDSGAELVEVLRTLACDGGTRLADLDLASAPNGAEAWLLFTDGLSTLGEGLPNIGGVPVFTLCGQTQSNTPLMAHLSDETGGMHVNLVKSPGSDALEAVCSGADNPRVASFAGCEDVVLWHDGGRVTILGRLTGESASVDVVGTTATEFTAESATARSGRLVARAWAGHRAQAAALVEGSKSESALALARRYGLVTPGTSLLVLESLEQYVEYDIEPPETLPRLREAWRKRRGERREADALERKSHLDIVVGWWEQRIAWWETDFEARIREEDENRRMHEADGVGDEPSRESDRHRSGAVMRPSAASSSLAGHASSGAAPGASTEEFLRAAEAGPEGALGGAGDDLSSGRPAAASIAIQPWNPDTPYLNAMREADDSYAAYLEQRKHYAGSPSFFLDCGDHLLTAGHQALGVRVLSNLMELALDDVALMRMYAWRLQQAGELDQAVEVFEQVLEKRDDEPQSHRDLALALRLRFDRDARPEDATRAIALLYEVVQRAWQRFPQIEVIALMELNRLVHVTREAGVTITDTIEPKLLRHLDLDMRISMSWDADLTDVDLHVFEPGGGHAYYGHNRTRIGGLVSRDFTLGYGPEEYVIRKAMSGDYLVKAHYYGSQQQTLTGPCTVSVTAFTNWGRPAEQRQVLTLRLDEPGKTVEVGKITIEGATSPPRDTPTPPAWRETFSGLRTGMSIDEVTAVCGQPATLQGDDQPVLIYRPEVDVELRLVMAPRLVAVRLVMDGAELDLI